MDPDGKRTSTWAVLLAAAGQNRWPPAGSYMAATGQDLMAADRSDADRYREHLQRVKSTLLEDFDDNLERFLKDRHREAIMSVVELLPKEELADMVESLVSLTSLKRRMTPGAETVGGPVDVAVLSKGDGFVWIKRKHYFPKELNVRYFARAQG